MPDIVLYILLLVPSLTRTGNGWLGHFVPKPLRDPGNGGVTRNHSVFNIGSRNIIESCIDLVT